MIAGVSIGLGLAVTFFALSYGAGLGATSPVLARVCASALLSMVVGTAGIVVAGMVGEIWTWARGSRRGGK